MNNQLTLPERDRKSLDFCEKNNPSYPDAVAHWLEQLPGTNIAETGKSLKIALNEITHFDCDPAQSFQLIELLRVRSVEITKSIVKAELDQSIIFDAQQQEYFQLCSQLLRALVQAYKSVIQNCLDKQEKGDLLAKACHRAIADSGHLYLFYCQLYRPAATRFWFELHSLFQIANKLKLLEFKQPDLLCDKKRQLSTADCYKQILLMSRSRFNQLTSEEIIQIWNALKLWAPHCKITQKIGMKTYFAVNLKSDDGMHYAAPDPDAPAKGVIGLDTHILNAHLKKLQQEEPKNEALSSTLVSHLATAWSQISKRKFQRKDETGQCLICSGLNAAHFQLSRGQEFKDIIAPYNQGGPQNNNAFDPDKSDIWGEVYDANKKNKEKPEIEENKSSIQFNNTASATDNPAYAPIKADIINVSAGGYCLQITKPSKGKFNIGEVLVLDESDGENPHWLLGVIRWVEILQNGVIKIGVELLSAKAEPCAIAHIHKTREMKHFQRCLHLPDIPAIRQQASLVMPRLGVKSGQKFRLIHRDTQKSGQLMKCILSTATFAQYQYNLLE